jgi:hypothetical protein
MGRSGMSACPTRGLDSELAVGQADLPDLPTRMLTATKRVQRCKAVVPSNQIERLEEALTQQGIRWTYLSRDHQLTLANQWQAFYGQVWSPKGWMRHKEGLKAQVMYGKEAAETFLIVPVLGSTIGPHATTHRGPGMWGYECHGSGVLPDLSRFCGLEFFISPPDLGWTMLHTHEDFGLGGPYFIRRDWLVPANTRRKSCEL